MKDEDIGQVLLRFGGSTNQPRLTYLGYLNLLKPFFAVELARDLLLRNSVAHGKAAASDGSASEAVLLLLRELLLLNCVCAAEHEQLKAGLMEEYMLNGMEVEEILGLGQG